MIVYAKCIQSTQVAESRSEFLTRQSEEYAVYCIGEKTKSKNNADTLSCVPINYIYDCLKHGMMIAIVRIVTNRTEYTDGYYDNETLSLSEQHIIDIMPADSKSTIDFVFDTVGNPHLVHNGYVHYLSKENQEYFQYKKQLANK